MWTLTGFQPEVANLMNVLVVDYCISFPCTDLSISKSTKEYSCCWHYTGEYIGSG